MIIGLGYKARSGKDTIAEFLAREYHFHHTAFSHSLKEAARVIFGLTDAQLYGDEKEKLDLFWDDSPRRILQLLGTECVRKGYRDDVWIKSVARRIFGHREHAHGHWVISDVRFPNEARAIQSWGGIVVRVDRDNRDSMANAAHASELAMNSFTAWDDVIENHGTFEQLEEQVISLLVKHNPGQEFWPPTKPLGAA